MRKCSEWIYNLIVSPEVAAASFVMFILTWLIWAFLRTAIHLKIP